MCSFTFVVASFWRIASPYAGAESGVRVACECDGLNEIGKWVVHICRAVTSIKTYTAQVNGSWYLIEICDVNEWRSRLKKSINQVPSRVENQGTLACANTPTPKILLNREFEVDKWFLLGSLSSLDWMGIVSGSCVRVPGAHQSKWMPQQTNSPAMSFLTHQSINCYYSLFLHSFTAVRSFYTR